MTEASSADTQWPRWEVFKQDAPGRPHAAVGSVHAGDARHALHTARNVFARRPAAVSMWVAPAGAILSRTQEELAAGARAGGEATAGASGAIATFLVFRRDGHRSSMTFVEHVGEVRAGDAEAALERALEAFASDAAVAWWIVPEERVVRSSEEDVGSWFEPAKGKTYKQQSEYGTIGSHPGSQRGRRTRGPAGAS